VQNAKTKTDAKSLKVIRKRWNSTRRRQIHRHQPRRPIFWLVGTSMGMSPPIFGMAM